MKTINVSRRQVELAIRDATLSARKSGMEICGFLVDNGHFLQLVKTRNKCKRGGGFAFYVGEVRSIVKAAQTLNQEVVGTFHSHPAYIAEPGESDIENAPDGSYMLIIDVTSQQACMWYIKSRKKRKVPFQFV